MHFDSVQDLDNSTDFQYTCILYIKIQLATSLFTYEK